MREKPARRATDRPAGQATDKLAQQATGRLAGQEDEPGAVVAGSGKDDAELRALAAEEAVRFAVRGKRGQ